MTRNLLFILPFILLSCGIHAQNPSAYIKENAIRIDKLDSLNDKIYRLLSNYHLIMVGEMHGTNEPAKLVVGLAQLMSNSGDSVQVGLEIPPEQMTKYLRQNSDSNIYSSDFFAIGHNDGRSSIAWIEVISKLNKNLKVRIFFYDANNSDCKNVDDRDSVMYLKIKSKIKEHPKWKTITLSGNIHNMLLPFNGQTKMALYLKRDDELNIENKICSLNHYFQNGTMLNNTGSGLELNKVINADSDYSKTVNYDNYLLLLPENKINRYNGVFFTRNVTAAKMANNK